MGEKWVKFPNASCENEIYKVGSPFNEDSKNVIFFGQGGPNFGGGKVGKFWKNGQKQGNLSLCKLGGGQF